MVYLHMVTSVLWSAFIITGIAINGYRLRRMHKKDAVS